MALADLPGEIHYSIFDFLDPIDSTCLGLTSRHFYAIHRRMRGIVPLSARRDGPNELEWAWHNLHISPKSLKITAEVSSVPSSFALKDDCCDPPAQAQRQTTDLTLASEPTSHTVFRPSSPGAPSSKALAGLRVRGQAYCRKCGITRCELHKHIQDWMGPAAEYCSVKQKFGPVASHGAKPYCYMSKPSDPDRCGRHRAWSCQAPR